MPPFNTHYVHDRYTSSPKHWCPASEQFAGGDHLLSALRHGWEIEDNTIYAEQHWKSGTRPITVCHFTLIRDAESMIMPVMSNPFVERFIAEHLITVVYGGDVDKVQVG